MGETADAGAEQARGRLPGALPGALAGAPPDGTPAPRDGPPAKGLARSADGRIHLPGLHALRAVAATAVVVHHVEQFKGAAGLPSAWQSPAIATLGSWAVTLFFVLSGYLITYLLLCEIERTDTVALGRFYLRRVLRIWPLTFVSVAIGFWLLPMLPREAHGLPWPYAEPGPQLLVFATFLANVGAITWGGLIGVSHLWSIGSEEQFYAVWAPLVRWARDRLPWVLASIAISVAGMRWGLEAAAGGAIESGAAGRVRRMGEFLHLLRFDCMALGGLLAWWLHRRRERVLAALRHPAALAAALAAFAYLSLGGAFVHALEHTLYGAAFAVVILNVSTHPRSPAWLDARPVRVAGDLSFGVYMYHSAVLVALLAAMRPLWQAWPRWLAETSFLAASLGGTYLVAAASWRWLESPFLRLKDRFAVVRSGG